MADEPISGLPAATLPLDGTELMAIAQGGDTVRAAVSSLIPVVGVYGEAEGIASSVTNASGTVASYTLAADSLQVKTNIVYKAKFQAINVSVTPENVLFRLTISIGGVPYDFDLQQPPVSDTGDNTRGTIQADFQIFTIDSSPYITGGYEVNLFNPNDGTYYTYQYAEDYTAEFDVGTDNFSIATYIESDSTNTTVRIVASTLQIIGLGG